MQGRLKIRDILAVGILILAGSLAIMIVQNLQPERTEEVLQALPKNIDLALKTIDYTEDRDGQKAWRLTAESASHSTSEGVTRIEKIRMVFFQGDGKEDFVLTAAHGTFVLDQREIEISGDVRLIGSSGEAVLTDSLLYREGDRTIRTDDPVLLQYGNAEISGQGLRLHVPTRKLTILSKIKAKVPAAIGVKDQT